MENKNKSRIEEMKKKLYQRGFKQKVNDIRPRFYSGNTNVATSWREEKETKIIKKPIMKKKKSLISKMLIVSVLFFVIAFGISAFIFLGGANVVSSKNVDIEIVGPVSVSGGEELSLQIVITNNNTAPLEYTDLLINYPEGTYESENPGVSLSRFRKSLGVIEAGETVNEIVRSKIYGEEGSEKEIKVSLEYRVEGSNAIFVKEQSYALAISSAPLNITIETMDEVNAGQEMKLLMSISSNVESVIEDVLARIEYPSGFELLSSDPKTAFGDGVWYLGDIPVGAEIKIEVVGIMHGQEEDEKIFRAYVGRQDSKDGREIATVYSSTITETTIKKPFVGIVISVDGESGESFVANGGDILRGTLMWINNLSTPVEDLSIEMLISGDVLDQSSVFVDRGVYHSAQQKIIWDKRTFSDLAEVEPGETGRLNFRFSAKDLLSSGFRLEKPEIKLSASVRGRALTQNLGPRSVQEFVERSVKINSALQLGARALYSTGAFSNSGPLPPKANVATTYTIVWTVINSSNDISGAKVSAFIPPYVSWVNKISPAGEKLSFDSASGEIVWDIGNIKSGAGISLPAKEVSFQISLTPSVAHIGVVPDIVNDAVLSGRDDFTGELIKFSRPALNTYLSSDPNFGDAWSRVVE